MDNNMNFDNSNTNNNSNNNNIKVNFIKIDDNYIVNEVSIRWIKKVNECLELCTKSTGCNTLSNLYICKVTSPDSYDKYNRFF